MLNKNAPQINAIAYLRNRPESEIYDFNLNDYKDKMVLLAFYPGDFTPVCTSQMCDFTDNMTILENLNVQVVGISTDPVEKHKLFAAKHNITFPLVSDKDKSIGKAYGVNGPLFGVNHRRALFLIDKNQLIVWEKIEAVALFRTEVKTLKKVLEKFSG